MGYGVWGMGYGAWDMGIGGTGTRPPAEPCTRPPTRSPTGSPGARPAPPRLTLAAAEGDGDPVALGPGMAVTVEIRTGRRRVLEYLLSPVLRTRHDALSER